MIQFPVLEEIEKEDYANYRYLMFVLPAVLNAQVIVETGLGNGHSTKIFGESLSNLSTIKDRSLHTFEIEPDHKIVDDINDLFYSKFSYHVNWSLHVGESIHLAHELVDEQIDLLYLDSDHSYKNVFGELTAFAPYLSSKAWIILDDVWGSGDMLKHYYFTRHPGKNPSDVYYAAMDWVKKENEIRQRMWKSMLFTECRGYGEKNIAGSGKLFLYREE